MTKRGGRIGWTQALLGSVALAVVAFGAWTAMAGAPPATGATVADVAEGLARADFDVEGMTCGGCALSARAALRRMDGVRDAGAALGEGEGPGSAWAVYDPETVTPERLMEAIRSVGYTPSLADR